MKKIFYLIFLFSFLILNNVNADSNAVLQGISKIYVEYEDGQYQVFELSQKVDYSYPADNNGSTTSNGSQALLLPQGELNQSSKIRRIALWMDNYIGGTTTFPINGYINGSSQGPTGATSIPIANWEHGVATSVNSGNTDRTNYYYGVIDFNNTGSYSADNNGTITITENTAFDPKDKAVNLRFKVYKGFLISDIQTQNL